MKNPEIIIATCNEGKMAEIKAICENMPIVLKSLNDIWTNPPDIQETGSTFRENAFLKAEWVFSKKLNWTLADDSGLEVDALNGEPGVISSRYAGENCNDAKNIEKLLNNLSGISLENRTARFRCVMILMGPNNAEYVVEGICEGLIALKPRGNMGFGYDPLFIPNGFNKTFAEMKQSQKNQISHRGRAILALKEKLYEIFN